MPDGDAGTGQIPIDELCKGVRDCIKDIELGVRGFMEHEVFNGEQKFPKQHGEMKGQLMLAVRHLEDARMRLGKVCQYADDGVSIFDKV